MKYFSLLLLVSLLSACMNMNEPSTDETLTALTDPNENILLEGDDWGEDANPEDFFLPSELSKMSEKCKNIELPDLNDTSEAGPGDCFEFRAIVRSVSTKHVLVSKNISDYPTKLKINWIGLDSSSKSALVSCEESKLDANFVLSVPAFGTNVSPKIKSVSCNW